MKLLTLVRHAKSSWKYPELNDFDRPLNNRGKRDLPHMASRMAAHHLEPDLVLSSGAARAMATTNEICNHLQLSSEEIQVIPELYESCAETLMLVLQNIPDSYQHIMLVGHNPGLEHLNEILSQSTLKKFPTAAYVHLHLSITNWHELSAACATMTIFDYPKMHSPARDN